MDMIFRTWDVRSFYRRGLLKKVTKELGEYELDFVGVQEVGWRNGGAERAEDRTFFYVERKGVHQTRMGIFV
jgi:hypothetical protein